MKVVLDTNIWLSAIFWDGEANNILEKAEKEKFRVIITQDILSEIVKVINRESKFQRLMDNLNQDIEDLIRTILSISTLIETKSKFNLVKEDPKDNMILEAAFDGDVDYIISYDKHLLNMIEFREKKILGPKEFLKLI